MVRHKGDHGPPAPSLNASRPSHATSDESLPVHHPVPALRHADSGEVSGRFPIPAVRPTMKQHSAPKASIKSLNTFLTMVQDASPNDPPLPPKPPVCIVVTTIVATHVHLMCRCTGRCP